VIRLDQERGRISLSLRQAGEDPWERIEEHYSLGQLVDGRVTRIVSYGAFIELEEGIEGLAHISELSVERVEHPRDVLEGGEILPLRVIRVDPVRRRLGLSFRRVTQEEWEEWRSKRLPAGQPDARDTGAAEEDSPDALEEETLEEQLAESAPTGEATAGAKQPAAPPVPVQPNQAEADIVECAEEDEDGQEEETQEIQAENSSRGEEEVPGDREGQDPSDEGTPQPPAPEESPQG
jgi:small subunit ribosomal protein S1